MSLPCPSRKEKWSRKKASTSWKIYRTRFLIKAQQLTEPLVFFDTLGREHRGQPGDYLVESSDGSQRIAPRLIFEDVYVAMGSSQQSVAPPGQNSSVSALKHRIPSHPLASA
jgi:hypothetical protein